jgi:heat shock protein HtpX
MLRIALFLMTNIAILAVLSVTMSVLGFEPYMRAQGLQIDLQALLVFAAVFGMGGALISLAISKWSARMATGARVIERPGSEAEAWLLHTVERLAKATGIGMPEVAVFEATQMNAFATGMFKNNALVAVSTGLLGGMNREQVEAVLAHEVSHVANGDMVTLALIQGVLNTFVIFLSRIVGHLVDKVVFKTERGHGPAFFIVYLLAQVILGVLANIVVMWFSRWREFRADAGAAALSGHRKMIAALERLKNTADAPELPDQLRAFGIAGGLRGGFSRLFMSHPPLDERIAALETSLRAQR